METETLYTNDTEFTYQGIDWCYADHIGWLLVTQSVVDKFELSSDKHDGYGKQKLLYSN